MNTDVDLACDTLEDDLSMSMWPDDRKITKVMGRIKQDDALINEEEGEKKV